LDDDEMASPFPGYEKARLERRRGELLTLAAFGVEGTLEERELNAREIFNTL